MDKKIIIILVVVVLIIIAGGVVILLNIKPSTTCTKKTNTAGFEIRDKIKFTIEDEKVYKVDLTKEIEIQSNKVNAETFMKSINTTLETAYSYASENAFEIEKNEKTISLIMNSKKYGVILDNIVINQSESGEGFSFIALNNIETEKNAIRIGDKYSLAELKAKAKEVGYTCK